jgi:hypothetical protein
MERYTKKIREKEKIMLDKPMQDGYNKRVLFEPPV